ncbi:MAG: ComEA family DNA-binding protein [Solirubrobacterales bacterium]|nr:ComEA family DNA-binding protein [Solirubrobacterales bacterium]
MPELSRSQILVYGAVGVALLLLGARWIRAADQQAPASSGGVSFAAGSSSGSSTGSGSGGRDVVVHVAGAVRKPGVYTLPAGSRVDDAVKRAGGITGGGSPDAINLAARLSDGQQVVVPSTRAGAGPATATAADGPISLGSATVEQLDTIEGIGPVTAQNILDYRDEHGGFSSVEEVDQVPGIGPATMEALKSRLQP